MKKQILSTAHRHNTLLLLICGVTFLLIVFGVVIKIISVNGLSSPARGIHHASLPLTAASTSAATNQAGLEIPSQSNAPTATLVPNGTPVQSSTTTSSSPLPLSQSATVYLGVHVAFDSLSYVTAFEGDAHKPVSIIMWYQQWGLTNGWQYLQTYWMNDVRWHGAIPLVTWDPENPAIGSPTQPMYTLQNIINGNFDAYITRWAQDSKAWGHPYFLRFAHEMNGDWNAWSEQVNGNKPGQLVLAWRHVHDIFTRLGVSNVTWVWAPNVDYSVSTPLRELYPGNAYVDWVGMSGYNWGNIGGHTWQSFSSLFSQTYNDILSITSRPMMIAETASTERDGNKASWITDAFVTQLPRNFPRIRAVVWFNESKETDWQIESSNSAQNAFAAAAQSGMYASNNFASLNVTSIPPL